MRHCRPAALRAARLAPRPSKPRRAFAAKAGLLASRPCATQVQQPEPKPEALAQWQRYGELSRTDGSIKYAEVNRRYKAPLQSLEVVTASPIDNARGQMSEKHLKDAWSEEEIADAVRDNVVMTWANNSSRLTVPRLVRGDGIYVYDSAGKEYMDLTSMAVCSNMGHTMDEATKNAIIKQMDDLPYAYSGLGMVEVRARLCSLLAEITPGDITGFVFPLGGSEANEGAIRIARRYTGKFKVLSAMRSYHGGTTGPLAATGDFRTRYVGEQPGFIKIFNPHALRFSTGTSDEAAAAGCLQMLEEQILSEGANTIAAIMLETIVGANGVFLPPSGYLEGVRALCDKYGILLILDEVMCGFWRTGPLFAFQHFRGVLPDILTSAKGLTSSFLPLGMIGMRQKIKDHFEEYPLGWGATYANHPVPLACAYEVVRRNCRENMEKKVERIEDIMLEEIDCLIRKHRCVLQGRAIGAFGCLDLVNAEGQPLNLLGDALPPEALLVRRSMAERGLFGLFRSPLFHICPPLIIREPELREMFKRIDGVLSDLDEFLETSK
uniref:Uncharacterized protein n=1 Tax=Alexandrium monilatum TaxID=311494 RepID=A0A7S4S7D8_9DINO